MKTVFSNHYDVIHKFAQRTQYEGRAGNVFFEGDRLYSYGRHYCLARFLSDNEIYIGDRGYSVTTAGHIAATIQATRQYKQWFERKCDPKYVLIDLKDLKDKLLKARKPEKYLTPARSIILHYLAYNARFGVAAPEEILNLVAFFNTDNPEYSDRIKKEIEAAKIKRASIIEQYKTAFYNFEPYNGLKFEAALDYDLLRINGDKLQTSQNISVNLSEAEKLYRSYLAGLPIVGQQIEGYTILKATPEMIKIGCHNIKPSELANIFKGVA